MYIIVYHVWQSKKTLQAKSKNGIIRVGLNGDVAGVFVRAVCCQCGGAGNEPVQANKQSLSVCQCRESVKGSLCEPRGQLPVGSA